MFHARLDMLNHTLTYANAGQTRPLLFRARNRSIEELDSDGLLMGVKSGVYFEEKITSLEIGDILLLYTDGVTDAENFHGEFFGVKRLSKIMDELRDSHPGEIMNAIFRSLADFTDATPPTDDVSLAILKVVPSPQGV
jgi:sigma-B regulation protein RsbU (phosphoserine phosphatase)